MIKIRKLAGLPLVACTMAVAGCDDFISVSNPNVVEASGIDPATDGPLIAWSAYQNFVAGYGGIVLYTAWFTTEAWTGDSAEDRSEVGRRAIDPTNSRLNNDVWVWFSRGMATAEDAADILAEAPNPERNIHLARVSLASGFAYLQMAETFCEGAVRGGPPLSTEQMLTLATERLTRARSVATAAGGTDGTAIANAAAVGLGRTHLQAGRPTDAAAAVQGVPAGFEFLLYNLDDPANRDRLGNRLWEATANRAALVVPPSYRALADGGDTRIRYQDTGTTAYDGFLRMYAQRKYTGWASPYRLATGLEARYIAVEAAANDVAMLTFVNERRAAGGHGPVAGITGNELLRELLAQKSLDFWIEGRRMADFRRHPQLITGVIPTGAELYKPAAGPVGSDTCFPLPFAETSTNPNFR